MKTYMAKTGEITAQWHLVDATEKVLGRLATQIATVLIGKHHPEYTPHVDTGDFVVVINAEKVRLTGKKWSQKAYQRFSGYPGGRKEIPAERVRQRHADRIIRDAVRRMLPKNKLARQMLGKLKVYAGPDHPHQAQNPQPLDI